MSAPLIERKTTIAITEKPYEKRRLQPMSPSRRTAFITQTTVSTASGPLITTINDLVAVVVYYGLAMVVLIDLFHLA